MFFWSNYADENDFHNFRWKIEEIKTHLSEDLAKISKKFTGKFMISSVHKSHSMCLGKFVMKDQKLVIYNSKVGIKIDHSLNLEEQYNPIYSKAAKNWMSYKEQLSF